MNHEFLENISNCQSSALVCASFCVTEEEVDQATRYEEGSANGKVFYQVTDPQTLIDSRVDTLPTSEVTCTCGEPVDCLHRRVACAANVLYDMERVERNQIGTLIRQGYTRESVEAHVMHGAPLVESSEKEPEVRNVVYTGINAKAIAPITVSHTARVRDRVWEEEQRKAARREKRATRAYGQRGYVSEGFRWER